VTLPYAPAFGSAKRVTFESQFEAVYARLQNPLVRYWLLDSHPFRNGGAGGGVESREACERALKTVSDSAPQEMRLRGGWWRELHLMRQGGVDWSPSPKKSAALESTRKCISSLAPFLASNEGALCSWSDPNHAFSRREVLLLCEQAMSDARNETQWFPAGVAQVESVRAVVSMQSSLSAEVVEASRLSSGELVVAVYQLGRAFRSCTAFRLAERNPARDSQPPQWDLRGAVLSEERESTLGGISTLSSRPKVRSFDALTDDSSEWSRLVEILCGTRSATRWSVQLSCFTAAQIEQYDASMRNPERVAAPITEDYSFDEVVSISDQFINTDEQWPGADDMRQQRQDGQVFSPGFSKQAEPHGEQQAWALPKLSGLRQADRSVADRSSLFSPSSGIPKSSTFHALSSVRLHPTRPQAQSLFAQNQNQTRPIDIDDSFQAKRPRPALDAMLPSRDSPGSFAPRSGTTTAAFELSSRTVLPRIESLDVLTDVPGMSTSFDTSRGLGAAHRPELSAQAWPRPRFLNDRNSSAIATTPSFDSASGGAFTPSSSHPMSRLAQQLDRAAVFPGSFDLEEHRGEQRHAQADSMFLQSRSVHGGMSALRLMNSREFGVGGGGGEREQGHERGMQGDLVGRLVDGVYQDSRESTPPPRDVVIGVADVSGSTPERGGTIMTAAEGRFVRDDGVSGTGAAGGAAGGSVTKPKKSFVCPHCRNAYPRKTNLQRHIQMVHEKMKPYKCDECHEVFGTVSNLRRHVRGKHLNLTPYPCLSCDMRFAQSSDLKRHVDRKHPNAIAQTASAAGASAKP